MQNLNTPHIIIIYHTKLAIKNKCIMLWIVKHYKVITTKCNKHTEICTELGVLFFISFLSFSSYQMTPRRCAGIVHQLEGKFKPAVSCLWCCFFCFSSSDGFWKNGCWTQTPGFMWNTEIRTMQDISDCFSRTKIQFPTQWELVELVYWLFSIRTLRSFLGW